VVVLLTDPAYRTVKAVKEADAATFIAQATRSAAQLVAAGQLSHLGLPALSPYFSGGGQNTVQLGIVKHPHVATGGDYCKPLVYVSNRGEC